MVDPAGCSLHPPGLTSFPAALSLSIAAKKKGSPRRAPESKIMTVDRLRERFGSEGRYHQEGTSMRSVSKATSSATASRVPEESLSI
jgi:hypothetical protein